MNLEFVEVFDKFKNDIYRLVYSYTKNKYDADDITQNVFIKLYNNFSKFNNGEHIKKWLIMVAINESKNHFLSAWKKKIFPITKEIEDNLTVIAKEDETLSAVLNLPKKYRIVIHLYYYEGYKINEIANILKEKETTIQTRLSRARATLKEMLKGGMEYEK